MDAGCDSEVVNAPGWYDCFWMGECPEEPEPLRESVEDGIEAESATTAAEGADEATSPATVAEEAEGEDAEGASGEETRPDIPSPEVLPPVRSWENYVSCQDALDTTPDAEAQEEACKLLDDEEGTYWGCYWYNNDCGTVAGDSDWYSCYWYQDCPEKAPEYEDFDGYLECVKNNSVENCNTNDTDGTYYNCYWSNIGCEALGKDQGWYDCYWYDTCEETTPPTNTVTFLEWLDCYSNTSGSAEECGDASGAYNTCYW